MPSSHVRLYLTLIFVIVIVAGFTIYQIVRTAEVTTTKAKIPLISTETYAVPLSGTEPSFGNPGAPNTIILFADLGSSASRQTFSTLTDFAQKHPDQFKLIWKDSVDETFFSKSSIRAHVGAYCAEAQHKFWSFATQVFTSRDNLSDDHLTRIAQDQALNIPTWSACFTATSTEANIQNTVNQYRAAGILNSPILFINGKKIALVKEIKLEDLLTQLIQ
jgi:protein-disulfide isomerase